MSGPRAEDVKEAAKCAACGQPAHRYGRNEGMDRFDPQACINGLLGKIEDLEAQQEQTPDYGAAWVELQAWAYENEDGRHSREAVRAIVDAALVGFHPQPTDPMDEHTQLWADQIRSGE